MRMPTVVASAFMVAALAATAFPVPTGAEPNPPLAPICTAPADFLQLGQPLTRTTLALASGEPVVIVAIGSSSTAGAGATSPANSYPSRLEAELRERFPGAPITVINRGANGEEAKQMVARFDEVIRDQPDLVLWQVGTNAVLRDYALSGEAPVIVDGIRRLKAAQVDVVLVDSQYAPKVITKHDIAGMLELLAKTARDEKVGLFERFAIMRNWHSDLGIPFEATLSPDALHMNDWSYGCTAKLLADSIVGAVRGSAVARGPSRQR